MVVPVCRFGVALTTGIVSEKLSALFSVAVLLPGLAVGSRRLHDIDKSGWFQLLYLIPVFGWIIVLYWAIQDSKEPDRYGSGSRSDLPGLFGPLIPGKRLPTE